MSIGSVQLIAVAFPADDRVESRVLRLLQTLDGLGTLRVLDLLVVHKENPSGDLVARDGPGGSFGAAIGSLLGFEFETNGNADGDMPSTEAAWTSTYGLEPRDVEALGAAMERGTSAAFVLLEHRWAADLEQAVRAAGAITLGDGFLTDTAVAEVAAELEDARAARHPAKRSARS